MRIYYYIGDDFTKGFINIGFLKIYHFYVVTIFIHKIEFSQFSGMYLLPKLQ